MTTPTPAEADIGPQDVSPGQAREGEPQRPRVKHSNHVVRPPIQALAASDHGTRYSIPQRTQALTLLSLGYTFKQVESWLQIPDRTLRRIQAKAQERGYDPREDPRILLHHVEDGKGGGRPKESSNEIERGLRDLEVADGSGREKSSDGVGGESGTSSSSTLGGVRRRQVEAEELSSGRED